MRFQCASSSMRWPSPAARPPRSVHRCGRIGRARLGRIGHRGRERRDRKIRPLRQDHHLGVFRQADRCLAERPDPRERAEQASTCRRRTGRSPAHARPERMATSSALTSGTPFGSRTARALKRTALASLRRDVRWSAARGHRARGGDRAVEAFQPFDHRAPFGQPPIGVDEDGQRALHAAEGLGGLRQPAELDNAGEIGRAHHHEGKHQGDLSVAGGQEGQPLVRDMIAIQLATKLPKRVEQPIALGGSPSSSATCSAFSRTRTRLKRKSAS